jgi:hypothetical protein
MTVPDTAFSDERRRTWCFILRSTFCFIPGTIQKNFHRYVWPGLLMPNGSGLPPGEY